MAVSDSDVEDVLPSTDIADFSPFIDTAGNLYDNLTSDDTVPSDTRDDVVKWLAAHLVKSSPERQVSSGSEGDGSVSYEGETGTGIMATTQGQQAVLLDPTGRLRTAELPRAEVSVPDVKGID